MGIYYDRYLESVQFLKAWDVNASPPDVCVVLGSGLGEVISQIPGLSRLAFDQIPGFKKVNVQGHLGELIVGHVKRTLSNGEVLSRRVAFLSGRNHAYEGNSPGEVVHNLRVMIGWGVKGIVLTNAAGCLVPEWPLGSFMLLSDQINATGLSPLVGDSGEGFGKRFQDMTETYDLEWQECFLKTAQENNLMLNQGTYYGVLGPAYETPAEVRMIKLLGGHAVGMSTVLEAIAARHMGVRVAGLSCLTNYGAGLIQGALDHSHVMNVGRLSANAMSTLLLDTLMTLPC